MIHNILITFKLTTDWPKTSLKVSDYAYIKKFFGNFHLTKWVPLERELRELSQNAQVGWRGRTASELWPKNRDASVGFNGFLRLARASTAADIPGKASPVAFLPWRPTRVASW